MVFIAILSQAILWWLSQTTGLPHRENPEKIREYLLFTTNYKGVDSKMGVKLGRIQISKGVLNF